MDLGLQGRMTVAGAAGQRHVYPGYNCTDRLDTLAGSISERTGVKPEEAFANWTRQIPAGRIGAPEEFTAVVTSLAANRACWVSATSIAVEGGIVRNLL